MGSALVRQWLILATLPKPPRRVDASFVAARLAERGLVIHLRTIQRDLVELASVFPIIADERSKPYGWRWSEDAQFLCTIPSPPGGPAAVVVAILRVRRIAKRGVLEALRPRRTATQSERETETDAADPDWAVLRVLVEDDCAMRRVLLGLADDVEVVEPASLRKEMADAAERAARRYGR